MRLIDIPCVQAKEVNDPTGCGDAYRSGLLYGIAKGWDWEKTGRTRLRHGRHQSSLAAATDCPTRNDIAGRFNSFR